MCFTKIISLQSKIKSNAHVGIEGADKVPAPNAKGVNPNRRQEFKASQIQICKINFSVIGI